MAKKYELDYRTVFASSSIPTFILRDTGRDLLLIDFNIAISKTIKNIHTDHLNKPIHVVFPDLQNLTTYIRSSFSKKTSFTKEILYYSDHTCAPTCLQFNSVFVEPDILIITAQNTHKNQQIESTLKENEERLELAIAGTDSGLWDWDLTSGKVIFGAQWATNLGYTPDEIKPHISSWEKLIHPDDKQQVNDCLNRHTSGELPRYYSEHRLRGKDGHWIWVQDVGKIVERAADNTPIRMTGTKIDISKHKKMEMEIELLNKELEKRIADRTRKLEKSKQSEILSRKRLQRKSKHLMEVNNALKVLLRKSDENKEEIGENMLANTKELIIPYLEKIQEKPLSETQRTFIEIIKTNLNEIISPFSRKLASKYLNLTPAELILADLIKHGKTTKQIASILFLSEKTIATQRKNIRKKIGISQKKINLTTYLRTYEE